MKKIILFIGMFTFLQSVNAAHILCESNGVGKDSNDSLSKALDKLNQKIVNYDSNNVSAPTITVIDSIPTVCITLTNK